MPLGPISSVSFRTAGAIALSAVSFSVANADRPADSVEFTVSRHVIDSWEAPAIWAAHAIRVNGAFVPADDLGPMLSIEDAPIDGHTASWSFGVVGRNWSLTQTERVFSRGTAVELFLKHGRAGDVIENDSPDYSGYVIGCDQASQHMPVVTVHCGDAASRYDKYDTCFEAEPFAGLTRLAITRELCTEAGIANVIGPEGAMYDKPLQLTSKRLFEVLKALWEPEGCAVRMVGFDTVEIWKPALKQAPAAADHVWTKADVVSLKAIPPEDCPSRWVVTGTTAVVDETGAVTTITRQVIKAEYQVKFASDIQNSDGTTTSTGLVSTDSSEKVTKVLEVQTVRRGARIASQLELQSEWFNPAHAKLVTTGSSVPGDGTAGAEHGGFNYVVGYIADGKFVAWPQERFIPTLRRQTEYTYAADGLGNTNATGLTVTTSKYRRIPKGVRSIGVDPEATSVSNSYVFDDDNSYHDPIEQFDVAEREAIAYQYADDGPVDRTQQDSSAYHPVRCHIGPDADAGLYQRFDGAGQTELLASFRLYKRLVTADSLTADKLIQGKTATTFAFSAPIKHDGRFDWGGGLFSDASTEVFEEIGSDATTYSTQMEGQVEQVNYPAEGGRIPTLFLGSLPVSIYRGSPWVTQQMEPFELAIDDDTALEWFGFERAAINNEFIQNLDEAQVYVTNQRRRRLSRKYEIGRPDHMAKVGDTIYLVSADDAVAERCIVARKTRERGSSYMPMATFRLEAWTA